MLVPSVCWMMSSNNFEMIPNLSEQLIKLVITLCTVEGVHNWMRGVQHHCPPVWRLQWQYCGLWWIQLGPVYTSPSCSSVIICFCSMVGVAFCRIPPNKLWTLCIPTWISLYFIFSLVSDLFVPLNILLHRGCKV